MSKLHMLPVAAAENGWIITARYVGCAIITTVALTDEDMLAGVAAALAPRQEPLQRVVPLAVAQAKKDPGINFAGGGGVGDVPSNQGPDPLRPRLPDDLGCNAAGGLDAGGGDLGRFVSHGGSPCAGAATSIARRGAAVDSGEVR